MLTNLRSGAATSTKTSSTESPILVADDLRKSYEGRPALRGLTFALRPGGLLGFLGPNGAGKTTAIRILTTVIPPDSGYFTVDGISSDYPQKIRRKIGVLPESLGFPKNLTGLEFLTYFGRHYGQTAKEAKANAQRLLEEVNLQHRANSLIRTYSRGMRQRLGIARSLINDPVLVFLDEPTLGLDPGGQQELLSLIERIARSRRAGVVLSSHHLAEIERICDEVVILRSGQVIASGSVSHVVGQGRRNVIRIHVPAPLAPRARQMLEALPTVKSVAFSGAATDWLEVEPVDSANGAAASGGHVNGHFANKLLEALIRADVPILTFEAEGGRLHDAFLRLTQEAAQ
ncbi:MAG: ABC transporter ATP-binding protein [Candidatus Rokuibacteriota bacterium]|nr:MAG: ABC transporter ATP-binding protein [Candidatus Rokubacteria bacterium]